VPARPPLTTRCKPATRSSRRCACQPHGEKVARIFRCTLQAARRGGSACSRTPRHPSQAYVL